MLWASMTMTNMKIPCEPSSTVHMQGVSTWQFSPLEDTQFQSIVCLAVSYNEIVATAASALSHESGVEELCFVPQRTRRWGCGSIFLTQQRGGGKLSEKTELCRVGPAPRGKALDSLCVLWALGKAVTEDTGKLGGTACWQLQHCFMMTHESNSYAR